jgi:MFS family permease
VPEVMMALPTLAHSVTGRIQSSARSFRSVLALPHAPVIAASSLVARLPKGMVPLATVLLLHQVTGSYALAGLTAALVAAGDAASTPFQGRLIDRVGRGWVLIPTAAVHVAAVTALLLLARAHGPAGALAASAAVAGVGMPPVSGSIKAVWPQLAGADRVADAYTIESLLQQIVFLAGPLLVALLAGTSSPAAALACSAGMVLAGNIWFTAATARLATPGAGRAHSSTAWWNRDVRILVGCTLLQGMIFGALPVGLAAVTAAARLPYLAGVLQAATTVGGLTGTFALAVTASRDGYVRVTIAFTVALVPAAALATAPSALVLGGVGASLAAAGLFVTPVAAVSYVLMQQAAAPAHRTEAFAWLSTGLAVGTAAGSGLAGLLAAWAGPAAALAIGPAAAGLSALLGGLLLGPGHSQVNQEQAQLHDAALLAQPSLRGGRRRRGTPK